MEESIKVFKLIEEEDEYNGITSSQEVYDVDNCVFHVWNLDECPEDAIIDRSLFSAYDWLRAVKYGIELARQGYTNVGFEMEGGAVS